MEITEVKKFVARLTDIKAGTLFKGLSDYPNTVYMKLDKNKVGPGITLEHSWGYDVLLNMYTGELCEANPTEEVIVLDGILSVENTKHLEIYLK